MKKKLLAVCVGAVFALASCDFGYPESGSELEPVEPISSPTSEVVSESEVEVSESEVEVSESETQSEEVSSPEEISSEEQSEVTHNHDYGELVSKVEAQCLIPGHEAYYYCEGCEKYFDANHEETTLEALTIAATGHSLVKTDAVAATCTTAGKDAYYQCEHCEKYYEDAEGLVEITDLVAYGNHDALQHNYGAWTLTTNPTLTDKGAAQRVCANDATHVENVEVAALSDTTVWTLTTVKDASYTELGQEKYSSIYGEIYKDIPMLVGTKLQAPTIGTDANGLTATAPENATKLQISLDGVNYMDAASSIAFANFKTLLGANFDGDHTIYVKAIGNGTSYLDSDAATYDVTITPLALDIEKTASNAATISYAGNSKLLVSGNYVDYPLPATYTATAAETLTAKVVPGWNATKDTFFYGDEIVKTVEFTIPSSDELIYDPTDCEDADLADDWDIKKYSDGWIDTTASIKAEVDYKGTPAVGFKAWNNYGKFRYSIDYDITGSYEAIKFIAKGDGVVTMKVQLMNSESGVYATYSLGKLDAGYTEYAISLNDSNWQIAYGGGTYTFDQVKGYVGMESAAELVGYFDMVNFILYGETSNGAQTEVILSDLVFTNSTSTTAKTTMIYDLRPNYSIIAGTSMYNITFDRNNNVAALTQDGTKLMDFTLAENNGVVTLTSTYGAAVLEITAHYLNGGSKLYIDNATGSQAASLAAFKNQTLVHGANVNETFEDGAGSGTYSTTHWLSRYYSNTGWTDWKNASLNSRSKVTKVVNMPADSSTRQYAYYINANTAIGFANSISFELGNYFNGGKTIKFKVTAVTTSGSQVYIYGGTGDAWEEIANDTSSSMIPYSKAIDGLEIAQVVFTVQASAQSYLYFDNFKVSYAPLAAPTSYEDLAISETFESCSALPSSISYTPSNVYFKNESGKGAASSAKFLSCYSKGGNKVTYTLGTPGYAEKVSFYAKNTFSYSVETKVVLKVIGEGGAELKQQEFTLAAGDNWTQFELALDEKAVVTKVVFELYPQNATSDTYCYLDNIVIACN